MKGSSPLRLALALCTITTAVNLQAPLYDALAARDGLGVGATSVAFACYVVGIMPVLLALNGLPERVGRRPLILAALCLCLVATSLTLLAPGLITLGIARFLMGLGTALTSAVAPAYMFELFQNRDKRVAANWVTASTSLGFGLGAAVTSLFVLYVPSLTPPSFWLYLGVASLALLLVIGLADDAPRRSRAAMLRLPAYPAGALPFGLAILLAWATVGLVIAILPSTLARHGLAAWSGFATFGICSCGVLFQPWARRLSPHASTQLGVIILPLAYTLIAWGALNGVLAAVLIGTLAASSACYGFVYLGGLSGVLAVAGERQSSASAGFFLLAYAGFSLPVVITGALIDSVGHAIALPLFGGALLVGALVVSWLLRTASALSAEAQL
ncbi:putative MFS family arabinose efflux permease [Chromohalobacter marismortui]|uniref:Putative MFS family arabinose efflux permease n=1 Tax=Chromohalobacter marismortui TaxID=42055 RepID=A0A4R7NSQ5_9GAMM|nr:MULTISPECIES: MFS transporter [Chromohalobacter]MCI0509200.1 MFS transporter [Chromohalobacter sp.]MCI0593891.1 MFS transporter [Chromohalobacter sp.]TDU23908.1 putative MFS family arabinose efflux permease [Chromohalobacter marismortui]